MFLMCHRFKLVLFSRPIIVLLSQLVFILRQQSAQADDNANHAHYKHYINGGIKSHNKHNKHYVMSSPHSNGFRCGLIS